MELTERLSGVLGSKSCDQTGGQGSGVIPRAFTKHKGFFFFFSTLFTGKELCVSVSAVFYYKIHKATLTTGLVKCGVAHPSQATLPSTMSVKFYAPIVCTVVELSTLPGKEWLQ